MNKILPLLLSINHSTNTSIRTIILGFFAFLMIPLNSNAQTTDIELCVDLSCFQSVTAPSIFGTFNGWNAGANPITDPDADDVYCATVALAAGDQEYKFFFQEEGEEGMTPGDPCTVTNFGFTNRVVTVVTGVPQSLTYGWEVCGATCPPPPATADIELCVDLSCFQSVTAPSIFGTFNGWNAGANPITDPDGDDIYCATVALQAGDQEYKFFFQEEGPEDMTSGDPCTVTNSGFTNRVVTVVAGVAQSLTYGWEVCGATCPPPPATADIELCVDLSCFQSVTAPSVFGTFNGWNAGANPITDPDGDDIYCATVALQAGDQEYKFFFQEEGPEDMTSGDPCTVTNSGFTNRVVTVVAGVAQSLTYGWEICDPSCGTPPATADIELCVDLSCFQSVTAPSVFGTFNGWNAGANPITDPDGDDIYCATVTLQAGDQEYKFFFQEEGPEDMTSGDPCTVTNFGFTNRVVTVVGGVAQSLTYGWEICDPSCGTPPATADIELCVDLSCFQSVTAPSVFGTFNGWNAGANPITDPDGDDIYCATVTLQAGDQEYKFFFQEEGEENMTPGDPCTVTNFGFTNRVVTVVGGVAQSLTYGWEVCDAACPPPMITFCVDLSCFPSVTAPSIFGAFNGWCANCTPITDPDLDGIYCTTIPMDPGDQEYKFFFQEQGEEVLTPGDPCTKTSFGFTNRVLTVVAGMDQMVTYGWETCDDFCTPALPGPELPITFEDQANVDYKIVDFAGACSVISPDPVDPANTVVCTIKKNGALTYAGTIIGEGGMESPIPFTTTEQKISVRVWSPAAGIPILLKVENSSNGGISSEVLTTTTASMMWETLVFDFSNGAPPVNLANVYDKVVIFFNFGNAGTNQTFYFDDIMMCPPATVALTCPMTITADACSIAEVAPYADLAAFLAAGGQAVDADPNSLSVLSEVASGTCPISIQRTYQVTDLCKNTATCVQTITLEDNTPASIVCPADMTVECETDIIVDVSLPVVSDNCDVALVVTSSGPTLISGQADCNGARYEVVYSTQDACGNGIVSCTQTWTIANTGPTIVCPPGFLVECAEDIIVDPSDPVVTTACMLGFNVEITGPSIQNGLPNCPGTTYTYFYVVQDDCGRQAQCDRTFTIENDGPMITANPADVTVECVDQIIPSLDGFVVEIACDGSMKWNISDPALVSGQEGCSSAQYEVLYTVTDPCGRTDDHTQTWTLDNAAPVIMEGAPDRIILCSADVLPETDKIAFSVSCDLGYTLTAGAPVAMDNLGECPGAAYEITYTLADDCGRSASYTQSFALENNAPRVFPEEGQTVSCREDINPTWDNASVETDCNMGIVRREIFGPIEDGFGPDCNGRTISYLYSVWDACGRMTCNAQMWTIQNDGPVFNNAPADVTVDCADIPDGLDVTVSYNSCGTIDVTIDDVQVAQTGNNYTITRTFTADDGCGNTISHVQEITVLCPVPPSSHEYCTENEYFWGNGKRVNAKGLISKEVLDGFNLSANPLVLGLPEQSLTIASRACVLRLLPSVGSAINAFPKNTGDILLKWNCTPTPIATDSKGRIKNRLAGQVLTLMLNERYDPKLTALLLEEICVEIPQGVWSSLPAYPNVGNLRELGNRGLGGDYTGDLVDLKFSLQLVNDYFEGCRAPACGTDRERSRNIKADLSEHLLKLHPNPSNAEAFINYQLEGEEIEIRIYSSTGELMYSSIATGGTFVQTERVEVVNWPAGFYMVTLTNGTQILTEKLIKM